MWKSESKHQQIQFKREEPDFPEAMPGSPSRSPLKATAEPNKMLSHLPKLEFEAPSPLMKTSPTRTSGLGSPGRNRENTGLGSPSRLSPMKGMDSSRLSFSTTPQRSPNQNTKTQSVDRNGFERHEETKPEITFNSLKGLAPSALRNTTRTPSRVTKRQRNLPNSDRIFRFGAPLKVSAKDVNTNLLDKFKTQGNVKSCLKTNDGTSAVCSNEGTSDEDTDMRTSLNTLKNAESAKHVKAFLNNGKENADLVQPRKRKRAVTFTSELNQIDEVKDSDQLENSDISTQRLLNLVLKNQEIIMSKLESLENRLG